MTDIELINFTIENDIEYHIEWEENEILYFVPIYLLNEFNQLLGHQIMSDEPIICYMKPGYFIFHMKDICEYFGINTNKIF